MVLNRISILFLFFGVILIYPFSEVRAQLSFTENKGQWDQRVLFQTTTGNAALFLSPDGYTVLQHHPADYQAYAAYIHGHNHEDLTAKQSMIQGAPPVMRSHAYRVRFTGVKPNPEIVKEKAVSGYENYFIGNDPAKWASGCRSYQAITYKNIYPNVDLRYYVLNEQLKYDLIVHPGADVSGIRLHYEGAEDIRVKDQQLVIKTSVGEARELKPYSYQFVDGVKQEVTCRYNLEGNILRFDVRGADKTKTLISETINGQRKGFTRDPINLTDL
jgi:hypothetical protein